ncbi:MAG: OmpH family outer membrane protein [Chromatiaceae bacterium]
MRHFALIATLLLGAPAMAAGPADIGYVDMQQVFDKSQLGQKAQETIKGKLGDKQKKLAEEEQAIRRMQQTLARDEPLMSQAELDKKKKGIATRLRDFQKKAAEFRQQLAQEPQWPRARRCRRCSNAVRAAFCSSTAPLT